MLAASCSDIGKVRSQNQDAVFASTEPVGALPNLFIVADGMGGHNAGEIASNRSLFFFREYLEQHTMHNAEDGFLDLMVSAAAYANEKIYEQSTNDPSLSGMGTTFTACVFTPKCEIVHIGDSRAYLIHSGNITQLTNDHSYVNEMIRAGQLTQSEAREHPNRHVLTRVLGVDPYMTADGYVYEAVTGSTVLLCSDGLTNMLSNEALCAIVSSGASISDRAQALVDEANRHGGNDNISVVLIDV